MGPPEIAYAPCGTRPRFFNDHGRAHDTAVALAGDLPTVDSNAVVSVLQFGAMVPPLAPWVGVHRFIPGYRYRGTDLLGPVALPRQGASGRLSVEQQVVELETVVDTVLRNTLRDDEPVVLFSGGVDSGFLASRLAAMGVRGTTLAHYSFGDDDPENAVAEEMARVLGLRFVRIAARAVPSRCLDDPGRVYPLPFGDFSTVPTSDLARSVLETIGGRPRTIIDGTGADGAFGMTEKVAAWRKVARLPRFLRHAAALAYGSALWHRTNRLENVVRVFLRSVDMSLVAAMVAQNPLAGIFYPREGRETIDSLLESWIDGWADDSPVVRVVAADLALTCANVFAQKAGPMYEAAGHVFLCPFLSDDVVSLALGAASTWPMDEPKAPLKASLARHVRRDMIYRRKSAFVDPRMGIFRDSRFLDHLHAVADPTSPIAACVRPERILRACDLLKRGSLLPHQTLNLLWAMVFTDRWYRTALP